MESLNHSLFFLFNASPETPAWAIEAGRLLAKRVIYLIPLLLVASWLWGDTPRRNTSVKALTVTVLALGTNHVIGFFVHTQRPFEMELGHTFLAHAATAAFPSNHLTIFLCVGLCFLRGAMPRLGFAVITSGFVVAWARIFVGVHFPLDMAGAVVVAFVAYSLVTPFWDRRGMAVTTQMERIYRRVLSIPISAGWLRP